MTDLQRWFGGELVPADEQLRRRELVGVAELLWGFEQQMAARLVFTQWLYQTRRLSDWSDGEVGGDGSLQR
jgi:hypothetical protein